MNRAKNSPLYFTGFLVILLFMLWAVAACAPQKEHLRTFEDGASVALLTGTALPESPPSPGFDSLTLPRIEGHLSRIFVRMATWITLVKTEPKPLLNDLQVAQFGLMLARRLPGLAPEQRLLIEFRDRYKNQRVAMQVFREGEYLVFDFRALSQDSNFASPGKKPPNEGFLEKQPGQIVEMHRNGILLKEPILGEILAGGVDREAKLELIGAAANEKMIGEEERLSLLALMKSAPMSALADWNGFFRQRRILQEAYEEGLIGAAQYKKRRDRLHRKLAPKKRDD